MKMKNRLIFTLFFLFYLGLVLFLCLFRFSGGPELDLGRHWFGIRLDRYVHALMFLPYPVTAWFVCRAACRPAFLHRYAVTVSLVSGLVFAAGTELLQECLTTYRDGDPGDLVADLAGLLAGTLLVRLAGPALLRLTGRLQMLKVFNQSKSK